MPNEESTQRADITPRVASLETSVRMLHSEIGDIRNSVTQVQDSVNAGFAELRRDSTAKSQTNWGWIFAAAAVLIGLVGAVSTALVRPLQSFDDQIQDRLDRVQKKVEEDHDMIIILDERVKNADIHANPKP